MKSKKKLAILLGASVFFLGGQMQTNKFKYYGVIGGDLQIKAYIQMACYVINKNNANEAKLLIAETIAVESRNGNARDYSPIYGEGLTQFDRPTFEDIKSRFLAARHKDLYNKIKTYLFTDIAKIMYEDLSKDPMASIVFARLLYLSKPDPMPRSFEGRWLYYKKHFNSELGATEREDYIDAQRIALFKSDKNNVAV